MGASFLAGLATGFWKNKEELLRTITLDRVFIPNMDEEERNKKRKGWNKAVKYAYGWAKDNEDEEEE
jgi:glycerol kinase